MPQVDYAHEWTDDQLEALERKMRREYEQAAKEMRAKQEKALAKYARELEAREKALDGTKEAMEAHKRWLASQAAGQEWMRKMVDQLAQAANGANQRAMDMLNGALPHIYAENANMAAFQVDRALRADTGFTLVNEDAVRHLMGGGVEGQVIHEVTLTPEADRLAKGLQSIRKDIDSAKDIRWNRQQFTSAITQGILQGESVPNIVKRTTGIFGKNRAAATRAARTACTSAENGGRMNSFERAKRLGIDMEIEWCATLDERTRMSHRELDGERIELGERFSNGLEYPGDPSGDPGEVYNCRCRANGRVVGFDGERGDWADGVVSERWARLPQGTTYEQWKAGKPVSREESYENPWYRVSGDWMQNGAAETDTAANANGFSGIAEGKDILGTWQRRPDEYDFEIEDVMAAQGFDGKPRVVDADEFDRAVKAANNGDGLVMQRSYSAPDQVTLDAYRDMLYDGKWYVDCSTGGSQYGQGMYAAADYTGEVTADMQKEMRHYTTLNQGRLGAQPLSDEGKEAFLRRWVDENVAEADRDAAFTYLKFESHTGTVEWADVGKAVEHLGEEKRLSLLESGVHEDVHQMLDGYSYVETMTLDPSAKIIEFGDITKAKRAATDEVYSRVQSSVESRMIQESADPDIVRYAENMASQDKERMGNARWWLRMDATSEQREFLERVASESNRLAEETSRPIMSMDAGSFAAARGYDAINATGHGASGSYTVVLNRTKLIIRRPE